jgi:transcriptional regulator with XRE-family HTH domain
MNTPGQRIKYLRKEQLKLSQEAFGKIAEVTKAAVSQWERELTTPERDPLLAMQRNKNINPEWVKNGVGERFITASQHGISEDVPTAYANINKPVLSDAIQLVDRIIKKNKLTLTDNEKAVAISVTYDEIIKGETLTDKEIALLIKACTSTFS